MLPPLSRLKSSDFAKISRFKQKNYQSDFFTVKTMSADCIPSRFGIVVPASVFKRSNKRNLIKRRIRSVIRGFLSDMEDMKFVVIYCGKKSAELDFDGIKKEITFLFGKAGVFKKK
jgi:ribonuclease P protein component